MRRAPLLLSPFVAAHTTRIVACSLTLRLNSSLRISAPHLRYCSVLAPPSMSSPAKAQRSAMEVEDEDAPDAGAAHYDQDDSDGDDAALPVKRRRVVDVDASEDGPQSSASPVAAPAKARKPSASNRSAQEKDKKRVHVEDAKNTPSILSFFGQPKPAAADNSQRKDAATTKPGAVADFFAPKPPKKNAAKASALQDDEKQSSTAEAMQPSTRSSADMDGADSRRSTAGGGSTKAATNGIKEAHPPVSPSPAAASSRSPTATATASAQKAERKDSKEETDVQASAAPRKAKADARKKADASGEPQRKKGGPMSAMKRKRLERGAADEDGDEVDEAMAEIADEEEAAIEEEDAASSAEEDEEQPDQLARELLDMNKAAGEEEISAEEDDAAAVPLGSPSYHPVKHASWSAGQPVPYSALSAMFAAVEAESSRLKILSILSDFLRSVIALTPQDLLPVVYLCINSIAPAYEGKETGVGDFILKKVIASATGMSLARLRESAKDVTDLGVLALTARKKQVTLFAQAPLTVRGVFATMRELGSMSGKNVAAKKEGLITKLLVQSKGEEAKFLIRSFQGNLRIGLQSKSLIAALARALVLTPPQLASSSNNRTRVLDARRTMGDKKLTAALSEGLALLKQAYIEVPNLDLLISNILQYGLQELPNHCSLTPGVPVEVMLGKPASSITAILDKFSGQLFTLEFKYDGERAQIHRTRDGVLKVYSRNSEDNTNKYPDLVKRLHKYERPDACQDWIIDCECVAWDRVQKRLLPFQTLTTRKRKDVKEEDITVQVALFGFDLLYRNGRSYLNEPLRVRREALRSHFVEVEGEFAFAAYRDTGDVEEISAFLNEAVASSCEGLMVKQLDGDESKYTPGKRSWLKVKKDYLDGVGDTLDLVPIAAFYGKGKRTGAYGAYVLACYDEETEEFQSITKIGTGFSEEDITRHAAFYNGQEEDGSSRILPSCPREYKLGETLKPDVWLAAVQVWEVKCADLSISPVHQAAVGRVDEVKGVALRFPRFIRVRDDKKPEDATSSEQVAEMFENQTVRTKQRKQQQKDEE